MSHFNLRENLIERKTIDVTPKKAEHYLTLNTYEVQRAIRPAHRGELAEKMKDGRFRFGEIAFAVFNGIEIMMNGQHTCWGIIDSNVTVPCVVEKFQCLSQMDLADLFRQFENLPRSQDDMIKAKNNALKTGWPVHLASLVVAAAVIDYTLKHATGDSAAKRKTFKAGSASSANKPFATTLTKEKKVELLEQYLKEGNFLNKIINGDDCKHLSRAPVAYVMMLTMRKNEKDALEFWTNVRDGEILTKDMPQMKLREFLKSVNSLKTTFSYRTVKAHEYIYRSIIAWNSFRLKIPTRLSYSPERDIPAVK